MAEKSARDITELVGLIQEEVKTLAAGITATAATALREVDNSAKVVANIEQVRVGMGELAEDSLSHGGGHAGGGARRRRGPAGD